MNIELRNIQVYARLSEETTAFTATIYIDGKKVGWAKNDGQGGCTNYGPYDHTKWDLLKKADEQCKQLPDWKLSKDLKVKMDLEHYIDQLVCQFQDEKERARFEKKKQKEMLNSVLWGDANSYRSVSWGKMTIALLLQMPKGRAAIKENIQRLKNKYPEGKLLNTNIPKEIYGG